ncbi:MAG: Enoyl-CoA hydratase [Ignavibacteriae bacterium]|nr:MAG: Enoyl-CoA hydratase [Ignavibacteriota bacterium]
MNYASIKLKIKDTIAEIVLNRPEKKNALNDILIKELTDVFLYCSKNQNIRVIILTGEGDAFCSGADLEYLQNISNFSLEENKEDSNKLLRLYSVIYETKKPTIAMVNGPALAGGCGLATVCDFILASKEFSKFGYPEVKIGFIPAIVMVFLIKRVGEGITKDLVLTGKIINATEAKSINLINDCVEHDKLYDFTYQFAEKLIMGNSPLAMGLCKDMIINFGNLYFKQALEYAANMNAVARMTEDCKKGIKAFLEKQKIKW